MNGVILVAIMFGQNWVPDHNRSVFPTLPNLNKKPEPFMAPGRLFSVGVPIGWQIALHEDDPNTIDFKATGKPGNGILQIRRIPVPAGAHPRQLMLNAIETRLSRLPNFKTAKKRSVQVAGYPAAAVLGTFAYQGNLQFPVAIEEIYVVTGTEGFVLHFECFEPSAPALAPDLERFYSTFQPRPSGAAQDPFAVPKSSVPGRKRPRKRY